MPMSSKGNTATKRCMHATDTTVNKDCFDSFPSDHSRAFRAPCDQRHKETA